MIEPKYYTAETIDDLVRVLNTLREIGHAHDWVVERG